MTIGTKSVLFGAHCFFLHPWFVAAAWWQLYGFSKVYIGYQPGYPGTWRWKLRVRGGPVFASLWHPALWLAFFVHDLGYVGKPNMDGPEGETHPWLGARVMSRVFDRPPDGVAHRGVWGKLSLLHSRYFAKTLALQPSRLCMADKLAIALTPAWLYLPMVRATGEIHEYMAHAKHRIIGNEKVSDEERQQLVGAGEAAWYAGVQSYCRRWAEAHKDGAVDTWTSDARKRAVVNDDGVWQ